MEGVILAAGIMLFSGTATYDVYKSGSEVNKTASPGIVLNQDETKK